jgi:hypothetical protein
MVATRYEEILFDIRLQVYLDYIHEISLLIYQQKKLDIALSTYVIDP